MKLLATEYSTIFDVPGPGSYILPSDFGIYTSISENAENQGRSSSVTIARKIHTTSTLEDDKNNMATIQDSQLIQKVLVFLLC